MSGFKVEILADAGGAPGASIYTENFATAATSPSVVGTSISGGNLYFHSSTFANPVNLAAGNYWVSIAAFLIQGADDAFAWSFANAADGNDIIAADFYDANGWQVFNGFGDVAFQIRAADVVIPEPSSLAVLAVFGLAGMFVRRRRS